MLLCCELNFELSTKTSQSDIVICVFARVIPFPCVPTKEEANGTYFLFQGCGGHAL